MNKTQASYRSIARRAVLAVAVVLGVAAGAAQQAVAADQHVSAAPHSGQHVTLGLNKSLIIDLPQDARDVLVSNPAIADAVMRTSRRAYLIGMEIGQTNVFFFDAAGTQIAGLEVRVERDLTDLSRMLQEHIPGSAITLNAVNDNIILSGRARSPADAQKATDFAARFIGDPDKVLNTISVEAGEQVHLRVAVAEVQRTVLKQLGVDISASFSTGLFNIDALSDQPFSASGAPLAASGLLGRWAQGQNTVNVFLDAAERSGVVKILAEPTLSAISGESASFLAGGEFPVPVGRDDDGNILLDFKPFGVALSFTPVVLAAERISLRVSTEVSELSEENSIVLGSTNNGTDITIPGIQTRKADTTMELPSGGSMIMAGLIQQNQRQVINGVPGLRDIPVLGTLFRSRDYINEDTELVVIVTPYLVHPVAREQLVKPTDNLDMASDPSTILLGRLNRIYGVAGSEPRGRYTGQFGFIID